ncbi:MAG: YifB family Mg chelatase-like AAA ATPase [Treponema sp.]|nr:YifB family Mg chelatase-like AAA ATPase [Treponema sp.]
MNVLAYAPLGADGIIIRVEADIRRGIPGIDITGLAEGAVREARERVRASFRNSSLEFPPDRILINLAPAGVRKEGAALDLPIAISVMAAAGMVSIPNNLMVLGELELSGRLRPVRGVLAAIAAGHREGIGEFIVPLENLNEAAVLCGPAHGIRFFAAATLAEAVHALQVRAETGELPENRTAWEPAPDGEAQNTFDAGDFSDVRCQRRYKRALEIAAAGGHNLLVFGPPGSGKTMLARRVPSIIPPLEPEEAVEVTRLYSLAGQIKTGGLITQPPFRSPHHSASAEGVLGGGRAVRPGEITLAHFGTLFLDEAPEFRAPVLQSLREPLQDNCITIVRADGPLKLPADFQLILAANGCPCGRLGAVSRSTGGSPQPIHAEAACSTCFCGPDEVRRYWRRLGSALLDRVELRVPAGAPGVLVPGGEREERSASIARRVLSAVEIQRERFKGSGIRRNSRMLPSQIENFCRLTDKASSAFALAAAKLGLSGRACHAILKTARTIADLEGKDSLDTVHILEAVQHRRFGDDPYDIIAAAAER